MNAVNLETDIKHLWLKNASDFEKRLNNWLDALEYGNTTLVLAKKKFHRWMPLRMYVSVTKTKPGKYTVFSVRFYGQEVAELRVGSKNTILRLRGHQKKNKEWFGLCLADGDYDWRGKEAKDFRAYFRVVSCSSKGKPEVRSPEHRVESKFIIEMCKGSGKFGINELEIQPVMLAKKFPLQIPIPISANTGIPEFGNGYIDILARHRGHDNKTRLCVWELKKPHSYQHAASQAYIYARTILHIIRDIKRGPEWYKLFGFTPPAPNSLTIEAVVAITNDQLKRFTKERLHLERSTPFKFGNDEIRLYAACYQELPFSIKFEVNPFSNRHK